MYPLFIALNSMTGLSIGIGQATLYFLSCLYLSHVVARIAGAKVLFVAIFIALPLLPIGFEASTQRLLRDDFYTAPTLFYFAVVIISIVRHEAPPLFLVSCTFAIAVVTRAAMLAIIDASAFHAAQFTNVLPAVPLCARGYGHSAPRSVRGLARSEIKITDRQGLRWRRR